MTIATTDGRTVWAFRYSSEHDSRSLYFSTRMDALKAHYPDIEELAGRSDETRVVVSEPLGDLPGAWNEVGPSEHDEGTRACSSQCAAVVWVPTEYWSTCAG
jgi:glutamine amidotransferase